MTGWEGYYGPSTIMTLVGAAGSSIQAGGLKAVGALDDIAYKQAMTAIKATMTVGEAADAISGGVMALQGAAAGNPVGVLAGLASIGTVDVPGKVTKEIAEELVEEGLEKVVREGVEELTEESIERVTREAIEEVTEEAVEKTAREAVEEIAEETTEAVGKQADEVIGETVAPVQTSGPLDSLNIKVSPDANVSVVELGARLEAANDAIKSVCDLDRLPKVGVEFKELAPREVDGVTYHTGGQYLPDGGSNGEPLILINPKAEHPELSLTHETGHHFDNAFGVLDPVSGEKLMGSQAALRGLLKPELQNAYDRIFKELIASKTYLKLKDALSIAIENNYADVVSFTKYLMNPEEMFARSYAQYVAVKSGNKILMSQVESTAEPIFRLIHRAWPSDDFETISKAFDQLSQVTGMGK